MQSKCRRDASICSARTLIHTWLVGLGAQLYTWKGNGANGEHIWFTILHIQQWPIGTPSSLQIYSHFVFNKNIFIYMSKTKTLAEWWETHTPCRVAVCDAYARQMYVRAALEVNKIVIWLRLCTNYNTHCREQRYKMKWKTPLGRTHIQRGRQTDTLMPTAMTIETSAETHRFDAQTLFL